MKASASKALRPVFVEFGSYDTRRNLPKAVALKRKERNFLRRFESSYFAAEIGIPLAGREFGLEGFGCADLVWLAWKTDSRSQEFTALALKKRLRLTAIEAKMTDWRRGLQQAFRYRYFALRSLLVLPMKTARIAAAFLDTFRKLRIGLWGFDSQTGRLRKWSTPRCAPPFNRKAWEKAIHLIEFRLEFGQLAERR